MISARAELTSEEIARRRQVLAELNAPPPTAAAEMTPIAKWQTDLAKEAKAGRGIDTLQQILMEIKQYHAADKYESDLLDAIQQMSDCAHRHLSEYHQTATIEAIFAAVFPPINVNNALDAITINSDAKAEIQRLASLPSVQYERERTSAASRLGMRAKALDDAVKAARPQDTKGQGRAFELEKVEPWDHPVDGTALLEQICSAIRRYIILPEDSVRALALWAVHTHCFNCFGHSPRAAITSPEKGCGKTTLLDVLAPLVARALSTSNATVSSIFRIVELEAPTLLIDEADTFLKENDELRGILNTGHRRGGQVIRTVGDDHEPRQFSTWAPAAIAMIGRLPDTLNDRSVIISLRRRKPSERVDCFRSDRAEHLKILQRKMARWAQDHSVELADSDPDVGELTNRAADNWRPLFAIADAIGGAWVTEARRIANAAVQAMKEESINVQLFVDIKAIFEGLERGGAIDRVASLDLVERLTKIEGRPWAEWRGGKPLTQNSLARLLGKFEILSGTIRLVGGQTAKGYYRAAFDDAFARYLPPQTVTPSQVNNDGHCDALQSVTPQKPVTVQKASQVNNDGHCDAVTVANPLREAIDL
jgi:Protein of unknown function (DUF3631)